MSSPDFVPRPLTDKEQETFRRDFQEKEREIQRYMRKNLGSKKKLEIEWKREVE